MIGYKFTCLQKLTTINKDVSHQEAEGLGGKKVPISTLIFSPEQSRLKNKMRATKDNLLKFTLKRLNLPSWISAPGVTSIVQSSA